MKSFLVKKVADTGFYVGRKLLFNNKSPEVGKIYRNIPYVEENPLPEQYLDIIIPSGKPPYPILIYIHGGGFMSCNKDGYTRICKHFACNGYLTFNINYRLAPKYTFKAMIEDLSTAISWIQRRAAYYGGDAKSIFLGGDSAGAGLAASYTALLFNEELLEHSNVKEIIPAEYIKGLVLYFGAYNVFTSLKTNFPFVDVIIQGLLGAKNKKELEESRDKWYYISPVFHITEDFPPTFLCAGEPDTLYQQSVEMAQELLKKGVPHKTLFLKKDKYPEAHHAFILVPYFKSTKIALSESVNFMEKYRNRERETSFA